MTDNEATAIIWTAKKEWGYPGLIHRGSVTIGGKDVRFVVDHPYASGWIVRGWVDHDLKLYREAATLKEGKAEAEQYVTRMLSPVIKAVDEGAEILTATPACSRCMGSRIDPVYSTPAEGPSYSSLGCPEHLEPCIKCSLDRPCCYTDTCSLCKSAGGPVGGCCYPHSKVCPAHG